MNEGGLMARQIRVVGAVVVKDNRVLCAQRSFDGSLPGLWEFPGGKIEPGESPAEALAREIAEELDCVVEVGVELTTTTHAYDFGIVILTTFYCTLVAGTPKAREHADIAWLNPSELMTVPWAPADIPAVALIQADWS